jgi:hypothetical protein
MDVIETTDIDLAAYAMARGGGLVRLVDRPAGPAAFELAGEWLEDAEIDFAHFGPRGIPRHRLARMRRLLVAVLCGRRR